MNKKHLLSLVAVLFLATSCSDNSTYTEKASPANAFKDYAGHEKSILGIGKTISQRKSAANATVSFKGNYSLEKSITKLAKKYDLSVEWDDSINKLKSERLLANNQSFNEARTYIESVYDISIVRVRDRAIKVLSPATLQKIESFEPGPNVVLSKAVNGLAGLCGYNLVIAEYKDVLANEKITTSLRDVTCNDAFSAILDPFGLSLEQRGNHYQIGGLPYREWSLDLHEQKREEAQSVTYSSEFSGGDEDSGASGNYISGGASSTKQTYTRDLWTSLENDLKELVEKSCENDQNFGYSGGSNSSSSFSDGPSAASTVVSGSSREKSCGYVRVNPDVGVIQMQAPRKVIEKADSFIERTESIASRRLLIEARILAVSKTRSFDRGSDFNAKGSIFGTDYSVGYNPTSALKGADAASSVTGTLNDLLSTGSETLNGGGFGLKSSNLDAVVRYVESFGTTYQLMKPTLEVMDRQKATLIDGRNERYFVRSGEVVTDSDTPVVTTTSEEKVQFIGIQFSVSAHIAEDEGDLHTISLQIPVTEISKYITLENQVDQVILKDQIPVATTRVIDQKVRIRDGEIKAIGGLTRTIAVDKETGVPLLQEIPVAGKAFSEESITYEDAEFVVLQQVRKLD